MSKASGSIDLKSLKVAGEPNKYVTMIDGSGIRIHEAGAVNTNFSQINSNGMQIYKGGNTDAYKIADFGSTIKLYNNSNLRVQLDTNGLTIYNREGTKSVANFGKVQDANNYTATIGMNDGYNIRMTAADGMYFSTGTKTLGHLSVDGLRWYTNEDTPALMAHIGYGLGNAQGGGTALAPYYTFGTRASGDIGNWSVVEGMNNLGSRANSHTEGENNINSGSTTHVEGYNNTIDGLYTHAEGINNTIRSDANSTGDHVEGTQHRLRMGAETGCSYNHISGIGHDVAGTKANTVIGRYATVAGGATYENPYGDYAFKIGNGTSASTSDRSDALTVDWKGNVNITSGAKYKINGNALSASDVGALATSAAYTRSSAGTCDWSNQTDGNAKVIMKSALAYWNGAYSGTNSNLAYCNKGAFGTLATKNSLSASDVGAVAKSAVCYANSRVDTFSNGEITLSLSALGVTTGAKPVGILMTYQDGGVAPTILRYDYDASSASGVVIKAYNSSGGAVSGAVRYFVVVFQNSWTS